MLKVNKHISKKKVSMFLSCLAISQYTKHCLVRCHAGNCWGLIWVLLGRGREYVTLKFKGWSKCVGQNNFMAPFSGWGSTASRLEPLRGGSLLFTTKFPEIPGNHFIDPGRMKDWVDLGASLWFWTWDLWIGVLTTRPLLLENGG